MRRLFQDARYALRQVWRSPGFAVITVLTLALAVAANSIVFSAVNGVLLEPLPYPDPDSLVMVWSNDTRQGLPRFEVSPGDYDDLERQETFTSLGAAIPYYAVNMTGEGDPERLNASLITPTVLPTLGVEPQIGRGIRPEEGGANSARVALISHGLWQRRFGGDPAIAGRKVLFNDNPFTVIGVMPDDLRFPRAGIDVWLPMGLTPEDRQVRSAHLLHVVARLRPGVSVETAESELTGLANRLAEDFPDTNTGFLFNLVRLSEEEIGELRSTLWILQGAAAFILLIACANLGNLLLARAVARGKEIAIRGALGARRWDLTRQLLTEGLVLAILAGVVGTGITWLGLRWFANLIPSNLPSSLDLGQVPDPSRVTVDGSVLLFTLGLSLLMALLFALTPALVRLGDTLVMALKEGRGVTRGTSNRIRRALVVLQVAFALVLLTGAGLMIRSFFKVSTLDPGFEPRGLLALTVSLPSASYPDTPQRTEFYRRATEEIAQLPGVEGVAGTSVLPLIGYVAGSKVAVEGKPVPEADAPTISYRVVTDGYFDVLGAERLAGRSFDASRDRLDGVQVVMVNRTAARRFWPDGEAVGRRVQLGALGEDQPWITVIGVVDDIRELGLEAEVWPTFYRPYSQHVRGTLNLVVRTAGGEPSSLIPSVRQRIWGIDRDLPVYDVRSGEQLLSLALVKRRFSLALILLAAAVALMLAASGIYGVISQTVSQRTHEIGVRMALGADRQRTLALVLRQALTLVLYGLILGLVGALALTRVMESLLYEVAATDLVTYAAVAVLLTAVALLAVYVPAWRATRVDPTVALRTE